jgi:drug/metabolite transporter (DMT)-like permease
MFGIAIWTIVYSLSTAISITLLGSRDLIGGNLANIKTILNLVISWQFILAMILAIFSRFSFIVLNNLILKVPSLAASATTITALITVISFVFIIASNYLILQERLAPHQLLGAGVIFIGIIVLLK